MNWPCWTWVMFVSSPKFTLKGRHCISTSKLKSVALVLGLGPNTGFSMESGGDISVDVAFTCSDWTLMVLGTMFCLLYQACHLGWNFICIPLHDDDWIPGDANRVYLWPYCDLSYTPSFITKILFFFLFFRQVIYLWGFTCSSCWDTVWVGTPNPLPSLVSEWWYTQSLEKSRWSTPSGHVKELNPDVPYFLTSYCRIAGLDSTLQCQVALTDVSCPAPGMDLLANIWNLQP